MTQRELTERLAEKTKLDPNLVEQLQATCIAFITDSLAEGNAISLQGFGNFELKEKSARKMFNPTTKQYKEIPAKWTVGFRPSPVLKEKFKNDSESAETSANSPATSPSNAEKD